MSLSRILNDDTASPVSTFMNQRSSPNVISRAVSPSIHHYTTSPRSVAREYTNKAPNVETTNVNALRTPQSPLTWPTTTSHIRRNGSEEPGPSEIHVSQSTNNDEPVNYRGAGGFNPYSSDWMQEGSLPLGQQEEYTQAFEPDIRTARIKLQAPPVEAPSISEEAEPSSRKRRKVNRDTDYQPPRKHGTRKQPARSKQNKTDPAEWEIMIGSTSQERHSNAPENMQCTSDLEDCPEIWELEVSSYILECQKRQQQVGAWFEDACLSRNADAARVMSHKYSSRIASIPVAEPHPSYSMGAHHPGEHVIIPYDGPFSPEAYPFNEVGLELDDYASPVVADVVNTAAEEAAQELEESILGDGAFQYASPQKVIGRRARGPLSDASSDFEVPPTLSESVEGPANKKRKIVADYDDITDELERSIIEEASTQSQLASGKKSTGKLKGKATSSQSAAVDVSTKGRKKGPRKKLDTQLKAQDLLGASSVAGSIAGDTTPVPSVPASPTLSHTLIHELDEAVAPLKRAKKVDDNIMLKRVTALEEAQRKVWLNIAKRDVVKVYKYVYLGAQSRQNQLKRIAGLASAQARKPFFRNVKSVKETQSRAKKLMREMLVFWKKNEKEERDVRKRAEKEAVDRAKIEEEKREAARQARKLEFLISQTELYSHFVGNKLKTSEVEGGGVGPVKPEGVPDNSALEAEDSEVDLSALKDINFDDEDQTNLRRHARRNAQEAVMLAKQRADDFDTQAALKRKTNEALALAKGQAHLHADEDVADDRAAPLVDLDSDELNFQNPTSLSGQLTIPQPRMLMAQLKEYQLKGLNWLATLYEQGINGILADEMGLGKTVQSISLLAYLAETHDIWGPFLVVAPASTLHNWQQELTRFVPKVKALPYWGNVKDRAILRKFWSKKEISYNQDAPFHVLITSYQLVTQDQQYFQRVKWQYMILDEAQNIKNSSSVRWKTLLGFQCRNRLLLTGTPIQNNMQELWALLHFIMPSLFDSHEEFSEWFSKDIENAAAGENRGSKLNEHQLRRLHMILKPFMLRRVKRNVQNELSDKIEKDIYVDLSARQRSIYRALRANVSVADLLEKAANIGDADAARSLMNLVMQFRKLCNHPELFERADVVAPFSFCEYGRSGNIAREGDFLLCHYMSRNPIELHFPKLFYREGGFLTIPHEHGQDTQRLRNLMSIWSTEWMQRSLEEDLRSPFSFLKLIGMTASEAHTLYHSPTIRRIATVSDLEKRWLLEDPFTLDEYFDVTPSSHYLRISSDSALSYSQSAEGYPHLSDITRTCWKLSVLSRPGVRLYVPPAVAPPISAVCSDRSFMERENTIAEAALDSMALYGLPVSLLDDIGSVEAFGALFPGISPSGLLYNSSSDQLPLPSMQIPEAKRLIYDSGKLARLDLLLQELKAGDHRVLIYFQMTRMMDLMEEYLIHRQYKYLRLDGSSKLEDRRDMVIDWQTRPDIFIFLLSTRAGGLGINLTAADTVVFYDHDWNPSNDSQAMDRAHRLGQTRQVTVYRLITKGTIDERIVQLARVKKDVQDIVVGNKQFTDVAKPNEIVSLLLNDDELANLEKQSANSEGPAKRLPKNSAASAVNEMAVKDLWAEEGDDFFGQPSTASHNVPDAAEDDDAGPTLVTSSTRGRKKNGASGATRGRKPNQNKGIKRKAAGDNLPDDL